MRIALATLAVLGLAAASPAQADIAARYETSGERMGMNLTMTVEVNDQGALRVQSGATNSYMLFVDGSLYSISRGYGEQLVVVRMEDMAVLQAELARRAGMDDLPEQVREGMGNFQLVPTGPETVGGRDGTGYGFARDGGSAPARAMLVISGDPELAPLGRALANAQSTMGGMAGPLQMILGPLNAGMADVLASGAPLRFGPAELTDVSLADIDEARFVLPGPPVPLEALRAAAAPFPAAPTLPAN